MSRARRFCILKCAACSAPAAIKTSRCSFLPSFFLQLFVRLCSAALPQLPSRQLFRIFTRVIRSRRRGAREKKREKNIAKVPTVSSPAFLPGSSMTFEIFFYFFGIVHHRLKEICLFLFKQRATREEGKKQIQINRTLFS